MGEPTDADLRQAHELGELTASVRAQTLQVGELVKRLNDPNQPGCAFGAAGKHTPPSAASLQSPGPALVLLSAAWRYPKTAIAITLVVFSGVGSMLNTAGGLLIRRAATNSPEESRVMVRAVMGEMLREWAVQFDGTNAAPRLGSLYREHRGVHP